MGEPITQERLWNYIHLLRSVKRQSERLMELENAALLPAAKVSEGGHGSSGISRRMENAFIHKMSEEDEIIADIESKKAEMRFLRAAISSLKDTQEQEVLRCRYIDCGSYRHPTWPQVALKLYGDDDEAKVKACQRIHKSAIEHIGEIEI